MVFCWESKYLRSMVCMASKLTSLVTWQATLVTWGFVLVKISRLQLKKLHRQMQLWDILWGEWEEWDAHWLLMMWLWYDFNKGSSCVSQFELWKIVITIYDWSNTLFCLLSYWQYLLLCNSYSSAGELLPVE